MTLPRPTKSFPTQKSGAFTTAMARKDSNMARAAVIQVASPGVAAGLADSAVVGFRAEAFVRAGARTFTSRPAMRRGPLSSSSEREHPEVRWFDAGLSSGLCESARICSRGICRLRIRDTLSIG